MKPATIARAVLPFLILAGGAALAYTVAKHAPSAERREQERPVPLVETIVLRSERAHSSVTATGVVTAAQEVMLVPQVGGAVTYVAPSLVPGGKVKKGELLARIDPRDYKLAVEQQRGALRNAELQIEQEGAQKALAEQEWKLLGESGEAPPLFSRESQLDAARATLQSGKSGLQRAELDLARTALRAPFEATVVTESIDVGQVVNPGAQLAHLIGVAEMWVMVSVPLEQLDLMQIPGVNAEPGEGSIATVRQHLTQRKEIVREGQVVRLVQRLDPLTRRAQVVVDIRDPLDVKKGLPLLPGAHVEVVIAGRPFDEVFTLPREAIYEGDIAWVMTPEGVLAKRTPRIVWGDRDHVFAAEGLAPGDKLITTRLSAPIEGMAVKELTNQHPAATPSTSPAASKTHPKDVGER